MTSGAVLSTNQVDIKPKGRINAANLAAILVIFLSGFGLYSLTRFANFSGDDFAMVEQIRNNNSIGRAFGYFGAGWGLEGSYYAPLARLFFWLEYNIVGGNPAGWHVVSAALHAGAAVLVWLLVRNLTTRRWLAFWAGLFFAIQPAHVGVVAQATGQAEILAAIFGLASVITFIAARKGHGQRYFTAAIVFFGLALLCKPVALALPLALIAYDFITGGVDRLLSRHTDEDDAPSANAGRIAFSYVPFATLVIIYLALVALFVRDFSGFFPVGGGFGTIGDFLRGNLKSLAQPFDLAGTDGLILLAAIGAFIALTGVQEWEAWRINNRQALAAIASVQAKRPQQPETDDELDDPNRPAQAVETEVVPPAAQPDPVTPDVVVPPPPYRTLRVAGYGLLWTAIFLLPFILTVANNRTLYIASLGFALFLAAILTPFNSQIIERPDDRQTFKSAFSNRELSFWLRTIAVVSITFIYFGASVTQIDEFSRLNRPLAQVISMLFGV
jgi:hypothetical protein